MKTWKKEQPGEKLFFTLSLEQLRKAHEIYKRHCFCQDFLELCKERRQDGIGLCNLPYDTLEEETELLHLAYELYEKRAESAWKRYTPPAFRPDAPGGAGHRGRRDHRFLYK